MEIQRFMWFFTIMLTFLQHNLVASSSSATHLSPNMQKIALFQFKQSLTVSAPRNCYYSSPYNDDYKIPSYPKTMNWSMSSNHCTWEGVSCEHKTGDVIGLDLTCSQLVGAILSNSTLFQLSHLQFLNLSHNDFFLSKQFPQEFGFFAKGLTHLNLSCTGFSGRVPSGISHLYKLVSLDLSNEYTFLTQLEFEVFESLLQKSHLRVLSLGWVNISSVLPVSLSTSLRVLMLDNTGLYGVLPQEVFHLPNLEVLYLSSNFELNVILPKVKWGSSSNLRHLYLHETNLNGGIPDSIAFLESLGTFILSNCNMSGPIPRSIGNLSQLTKLDLRGNHLSGQIPNILSNHTNLRHLELSYNNLTGPFPSWVSHLTGPLPSWLFEITSLETLDLSNNGFTGQLNEFDSSKSQLQYFDCSKNFLYGPVPQSFSELVNLTVLDYSSNNFSGVLEIEMFTRLDYLYALDLSHNSLSVRSTRMATLPPKISYLKLSSCMMEEFPNFSTNLGFIKMVDLSDNKIYGEIPQWIGSMGRDSLFYLNLSHNYLTGGLENLPWNRILILDLQSNLLNGLLPPLICNSSVLGVLNLSHNNLSGVLPICLTNFTQLAVLDMQMNNIEGNLPSTLSNFRHLKSLNLHGNNLEGRIPPSFAEFNFLEVLDLGSNYINDTFPQCLEALPNLQVLVLKSNKFHGLINKSSNIENPFPSLRIIDLSYNEFSGLLPAIYIKSFRAMMNGDVNNVEPRYMGTNFYSDSTILVIKGVEFEFTRILNVFTTIDVSRNNFEGKIPEYIGNLVSLRYLNLSQNHLTGHIPPLIGNLTMLESLDLSSNRLEGEIPHQLSNIYSLARLNLSCNQLSGHIPQGSQFNTFDNDSYVGNSGLCGQPLSKKCEIDIPTPQDDEDDNYFFSGFTWKAVVIGYACGVVPAFIIGNLMLLAGKPKWFIGIIARELGLKIKRMEIRMR